MEDRPMMVRAVDELRSQFDSRDLAVLADIHRFRLLSTRQIQRLHFSKPGMHASIQGATRAAHRVLHRLQEAKLVAPLERRIGGAERGSAGSLWQVESRGAAVLKLGAEEPKRYRTREPSSALFIRHTVAIAEVALLVTEYTQAKALDLLSLETEPTAWRTFLGRHGQTESLRPDLYVIAANSDFEQHTCVEIDQATEHAPQILRKCHVYARYAAFGAAEKQSGVIPRVVWVTTNDARRRFLLRIIAGDPNLPEEMFSVATTDQAAEEIVGTLLSETTPS
jgi:hypothetical protein